jgi:hypothetical protein
MEKKPLMLGYMPVKALERIGVCSAEAAGQIVVGIVGDWVRLAFLTLLFRTVRLLSSLIRSDASLDCEPVPCRMYPYLSLVPLRIGRRG